MGLQVVRTNDCDSSEDCWLRSIREFRRWITDKTQPCKPGNSSEYCQRRGWEVFDCYVDKGVSGKKDSRPATESADGRRSRPAIRRGCRAGGSTVSAARCRTCAERWRHSTLSSIQFVSLCEQVDTSTPTGKLVFTILGAVAEGERNLIAERVRAGLRNARAKGKRLGRPTKSVDVARINSLRASGHSWRTIAGMMKLSVGTVYAAARSQHGKALCA